MHRGNKPLKTRRLANGVTRIVRDDYGSDEEWQSMRRQVLHRDNYCCTKCGTSVRGMFDRAVHHIVELSHGGRTVLSNLTTRCGSCHAGDHRHMQNPGRPKVFYARRYGGRR